MPQLVHQTLEIPLTMVESTGSSSIQSVKKRFTLIAQLGQQDQRREETLSVAWNRNPAPAPPPAA